MSIKLQPVDLNLKGWQPTAFENNQKEAGNFKEENALATPLEKLTNGKTNGKGVFDQLMAAVKAHLKDEYDGGRITGPDYANVYVGVMGAVLQTSAQFLLNEQQAHQIAAEVGLLRQKTVTELAQTDDNIPEGLGFNFKTNTVTAIPSLS